MNTENNQIPASTTRRDFLKTGSAAVAASTLSGSVFAGTSPTAALQSSVFSAGSDEIRVGLVGCGGRGTGAAAQALAADKNAKLVAMGDTFYDHLDKSYKNLKKNQVAEQVQVDADHKFIGFDAYQKVIDCVDVVLLTTPPHFRPMQLRAAIEAGKHVFAEKPVAVDAPGVRSVMETCKLAKEKNLSIVSGLCWRYHEGMRKTFDQIHEGAVGDVMAIQCSYNTRGLWMFKREPEWSDMEWQMRNWLYFTWLSGDFNTEQHVHSLDKMAWTMNDQTPIACSGTGGRQTRTGKEYGHIFDHFAIVYEYPNGVKGFSRCRQQDGCAVDVSDHVFGTKGRVDVFKHRIYDPQGKKTWDFRGKSKNMYQVEHDEFFESIRSGNPINNGDYMTKSTMLAIMGRMAAYTGKSITWDEAMNSKEDLTPASYEWGPLPVPPVAMPGITAFK
ncbi:Glycosyl hydrolase family 109 protein 1 precursor [Gimesia panareensis]|uniref:Glycosyl hydrolase family 109 protein 1 n=1 Tax=Gimesia panareensis TaxID=2527978 RepID=A0A518FVM7_9PLAN|nr:Gfo/Idh/MocA family oxidoreductase [Gimesia panareensis]QDV20397.1 Glycosyl hydrolase family 109 protein 1 precursor [Gimesia panareensis]